MMPSLTLLYRCKTCNDLVTFKCPIPKDLFEKILKAGLHAFGRSMVDGTRCSRCSRKLEYFGYKVTYECGCSLSNKKKEIFKRGDKVTVNIIPGGQGTLDERESFLAHLDEFPDKFKNVGAMIL